MGDALQDRILEAAEIVMAIYPNAFCKEIEDSVGQWFLIMTGDDSLKSRAGQNQPISIAYNDREKAWTRASQNILDIMLKKLEN